MNRQHKLKTKTYICHRFPVNTGLCLTQLVLLLKLVSHLKTARTSNETRVRTELKPNEPNIRNHVKKCQSNCLRSLLLLMGYCRKGYRSKLLISVQWLELVYEMATFYRFVKVLEGNFDENG